MKKTVIYVDMDDTICDYSGAHRKALEKCPEQKYPQAQIDFYRNLKPIKGAIKALKKLKALKTYHNFDIWILTKPSVLNPISYMEKRLWVEDHLGIEWCEKLILCPDKTLLRGDVIIDDKQWDFIGDNLLFNGVYGGCHRLAGKKQNWNNIVRYLTIVYETY